MLATCSNCSARALHTEHLAPSCGECWHPDGPELGCVDCDGEALLEPKKVGTALKRRVTLDGVLDDLGLARRWFSPNTIAVTYGRRDLFVGTHEEIWNWLAKLAAPEAGCLSKESA